MLRVIQQHEANDKAWESYLQGAGKKGESFPDYAKRMNAETRTPPPTSVLEADRRAAVRGVQRRLGRLYRPPIKA